VLLGFLGDCAYDDTPDFEKLAKLKRVPAGPLLLLAGIAVGVFSIQAIKAI
jgi:hypothetical protein